MAPTPTPPGPAHPAVPTLPAPAGTPPIAIDHPTRDRRDRTRRSRHRALAAAALAVLTVVAGACGSGGFASDQAGTNLERNLGIGGDELACMRQRFDDDGAAAAVMDPEHTPTDDERAAFVAAARACLPVEAFAALLAASLQPGTGADPTQADCIARTVAGLPTTDQDHLYVHFANPAALDAEVVSAPVAQLVATCGLDGAGVGDGEGVTPVGPVPGGTTPGTTAGPATSTRR